MFTARSVDTAKIGVMGHSLGGSAALGVGRQRIEVSAVIALEAPKLCDIMGVARDEFVFTSASFPVPVLEVYSDAAWPHLSEWPQSAANYALPTDPQATAFQIRMSGVGHFSLTDLALASPLPVRLLEGEKPTKSSEATLQIVNRVCLAFFDRYLKHQGEFIVAGEYLGLLAI